MTCICKAQWDRYKCLIVFFPHWSRSPYILRCRQDFKSSVMHRRCGTSDTSITVFWIVTLIIQEQNDSLSVLWSCFTSQNLLNLSFHTSMHHILCFLLSFNLLLPVLVHTNRGHGGKLCCCIEKWICRGLAPGLLSFPSFKNVIKVTISRDPETPPLWFGSWREAAEGRGPHSGDVPPDTAQSNQWFPCRKARTWWEQWAGRPAHGTRGSFANGKLKQLGFDPAHLHRDLLTAWTNPTVAFWTRSNLNQTPACSGQPTPHYRLTEVAQRRSRRLCLHPVGCKFNQAVKPR